MNAPSCSPYPTPPVNRSAHLKKLLTPQTAELCLQVEALSNLTFTMENYILQVRESRFPNLSNENPNSNLNSNMYVFPGIGLGAILSKSTNISSEMIYTSAVALSTAVNQTELNAGMLYPEITRIREVSVVVAREVIRQAQKQHLDRERKIRDFNDDKLDSWIRNKMYDPADPAKGLHLGYDTPGEKSLL